MRIGGFQMDDWVAFLVGIFVILPIGAGVASAPASWPYVAGILATALVTSTVRRALNQKHERELARIEAQTRQVEAADRLLAAENKRKS